MCALRASRLRTGCRCFLLELEVLVHTFRIVFSGNDAPKIIPDKSLVGNVLVFRMASAVNVCGRGSHISLGIAMAPRRFTKHGLDHVPFVVEKWARGMGGRRRGGTHVLPDCQETISKKAMTESEEGEGDSQARM